MQQTGKIDSLLLVCSSIRLYLDEFGVTDNLFQTVYANLAEIFAHLLGEEGEEVHHVLRTTLEVLAQLRILCGYTHRTGISITLTHHHAAQHNQRQCAKRELVGSQHGHDDHILGSLQLTIRLQANLVAQTIHHECLLCLCQSDFR